VALGGTGPDAVVALVLSAPADVRATVIAADSDTEIFIRDACDDGAESACNDDAIATNSEAELVGLAAGVDYFFVDGYDGDSGTAALDFVVTPN